MDPSFDANTLCSVLQHSGMDSPPATLRELVDQSEPDSQQKSDRVAIKTLGQTLSGFGERFIDDEALARLVREAATFPGNQTTFVNIHTGTTETPGKPVNISEELDAHIYNRRLLIKLYDADYPNPEACPELKNVNWETERYYTSLASSEDLEKLSHLRALDHFLAGSVARRESRSAARKSRQTKAEAMRMEQRRRFDAIRGSWPEPRFNGLDEYVNYQHDLSEQIWDGTVDLKAPEAPVPVSSPHEDVRPNSNNLQTLRLPRDSRLDQARELQVEVLQDMQSKTAKDLVLVTKQLDALTAQDNRKRKDLNQKQTEAAQQLVVISSLMASLDISTSEQRAAALLTSPASSHDESPRAATSGPPTPISRHTPAFQNINWQDVRPFTPAAAAAPKVTLQSAADVQQHIDSVLKAQTSQTQGQGSQTPLPKVRKQHSEGASESSTPKFGSSQGFTGK